VSDPGVEADAGPEPTWWGTGAAATQCEGAAPRSDWAGWEADGFVPPSGDGNGFRTRFADDLALWAEHGLGTVRLTVEWARLEPAPGRWDSDAADHLVRVLKAAEEAGVAVWACLLHGSAPGWFTDDQRGWRAGREAVLAWARHVDRVAEAIGGLVAGWVPVHEPDTLARLGYGDGTFPPGRHEEDDHRTARATLRAAEAEAARLLRSGGRPVGVSAPAALDAATDPSAPDRDADDLLVVSAPVGDLARELERTTDAVPDAELLVVTGDPAPGSPDERATRLRTGVGAVAQAASTVGVRGAFVLPAVDGYEWHRGFDAHLGLFDRDRNPPPALDVLPRDRA
jgi:beta-glucosidase/6-phospho-beta-glucosidase/beta-galactosidase